MVKPVITVSVVKSVTMSVVSDLEVCGQASDHSVCGQASDHNVCGQASYHVCGQ